MIVLTAFSVGELGNRSIKAWPSSKDRARLGSNGIEPKRKEEKINKSRSLSKRCQEEYSLWKCRKKTHESSLTLFQIEGIILVEMFQS